MLCPICNGLSPLDASCPNCGAGSEDEGRPDDWSGPYSPYEPTPLAAGPTTGESAVCRHLARCQECRHDFVVEVAAWHG